MQFKTLMLVVYPSRDRERYIAKAWGGLLISTKAFGDASLKISRNIATLFFYSPVMAVERDMMQYRRFRNWS